MENNNPQTAPLSEDTKTIITALFLCFFYPVGVILMWMWTKWQSWVKWTITIIGLIPLVFLGLFITFAILTSATNEKRDRNDFDQTTPVQNPEKMPGGDYEEGMPGGASREDGNWLTDPYQDTTPVNPDEGDGTMCTMDALECPDGSFVGRTGPNCEFVCPGE